MSTPSSPFLNLTNMQSVMEELERGMQRQHFAALPDGNARKLVFEVMKDVEDDQSTRTMGVAEKNDVTIRISWAIIEEMLEKAAAKVAEPAAEPPSAEILPVPERVLPKLPDVARATEVEAFSSLTEKAEPVYVTGQDILSVDVDRVERDRAHADFVDKIVKQPWAPLSKPLNTTIDISIDGFDRDFDLFPDRYRFQYNCGFNVMNVIKLTATSMQIAVASGDAPIIAGVPYVLLSFDEFSASYDDGANDGVRRSFCKFVIDRITGFPGGRQYARMIPAGGGVREFTPPMHSIGRITVNVTTPDGALLSQAQDSYRVKRINLDTDAEANWIMRTDRPWRNEFQIGDVIQLRGVGTASTVVNDYLNRPEGHIVIALGNDFEFVAQRYTIVIARPTKIDPATKIRVYDDEAQMALTTLATNDIDARVVNASMQISVSMVAVCAPSTRHEAVV